MLGALAYHTADMLVRSLPERWSDRAARGVARAAHWAGVPARAALEHNLSRLHPPALEDRAKLKAASLQTFEHFGLAFTDFLRLGHLTPGEVEHRVQVHGGEHLEAARRSGRGCVLMSVHAGCWEWGAAYLAARGVPVRILARTHSDRGVERFFRRRRAGWGVQPLGGSPIWVEAAHALRAGEWVAVMGDRAVPGMHGSLCGYAAALARRTGAWLLPVAMTRLPGGRHALWCDAPIAADSAHEGEIRAALHRHLERSAGQWFAFAPLPEGLA